MYTTVYSSPILGKSHKTVDEIEQELRYWMTFEATCQEDYDHACKRVQELTEIIKNLPPLIMHKCGVCGCGEPTDGSFLGFHAHDRMRTGEVCDYCAHIHGCNCCEAVAEFAWRGYLVEIGILEDADDPRQFV
jgi:hypothetical protein